MIKKKLKRIAEIKSGYPFRHGVQQEHNGNVRVIQLKDMDENGSINARKLSMVSIANLKSNRTLEKGDIIFKSKSINHMASVLTEDVHSTIATHHFLVLQIRSEFVLPEYVTWYLNQQPAKRYFKRNAAGTRIPFVSKKVLEELVIPIPPLDVQKKIVEIDKLSQREQSLREEILGKRVALIQAQLLDILDRNES